MPDTGQNHDNAATPIGSEYPKIMYRKTEFAKGTATGHDLNEQPLKMGGEHSAETRVVHGEDDELMAAEEGWATKLRSDPEPERRGPGRTPKQETANG